MKTKADKLRDIHIRKLRSLAVPLDPKMRLDGERRFFEWSIVKKEDVGIWQSDGKLRGKLDRVWVPLVRYSCRCVKGWHANVTRRSQSARYSTS